MNFGNEIAKKKKKSKLWELNCQNQRIKKKKKTELWQE